jgi:polyisoprenoid-binding protein YceI
VARYRIRAERSRIDAEARSSLHPIRAGVTGVRGWFDAEPGAPGLDPGVTPGGQVEIDVAGLRTGNALYDAELGRRLEAKRFPVARGEVRGVRRVAADRYAVRGDLTLHGRTSSVEGTVRVRVLDDGSAEVEGELAIDMRDFGLEPPRVLLLKVHPRVTVRGHVVAGREDGA